MLAFKTTPQLKDLIGGKSYVRAETPEEEILKQGTNLDKKASYDEVYLFAIDKYKGNQGKSASFVRGWAIAGEKKQ